VNTGREHGRLSTPVVVVVVVVVLVVVVVVVIVVVEVIIVIIIIIWRHSIFPTTSSSSPILTAAVSGRRHPCSWRSDVHGCPLSAIMRFRWPDAAFGTVCHLMSRQLQRLLFFGIASRLASSQDHFLHNS